MKKIIILMLCMSLLIINSCKDKDYVKIPMNSVQDSFWIINGVERIKFEINLDEKECHADIIWADGNYKVFFSDINEAFKYCKEKVGEENLTGGIVIPIYRCNLTHLCFDE